MVCSKLTAVDGIGLLVGYLNAEFLRALYEWTSSSTYSHREVGAVLLLLP